MTIVITTIIIMMTTIIIFIIVIIIRLVAMAEHDWQKSLPARPPETLGLAEIFNSALSEYPFNKFWFSSPTWSIVYVGPISKAVIYVGLSTCPAAIAPNCETTKRPFLCH